MRNHEEPSLSERREDDSARDGSTRLLLCDLDNTLIDRASAFGRWAKEFAGREGLGAGAADIIEDLDGDGFTPRREWAAAVLARFSLKGDVDVFVDQFFSEFCSSVRCADDVLAALVRFRSNGWRIGIVTNGGPTQELKIRSAGLDQAVDTWCVSSIVGVAKPDPRIFALAAERCGMPLAGGWMVGDTPEADIAGAAAVDLRTAWISRGRSWVHPEVQPDVTATAFCDALAAIERLS